MPTTGFTIFLLCVSFLNEGRLNKSIFFCVKGNDAKEYGIEGRYN